MPPPCMKYIFLQWVASGSILIPATAARVPLPWQHSSDSCWLRCVEGWYRHVAEAAQWSAPHLAVCCKKHATYYCWRSDSAMPGSFPQRIQVWDATWKHARCRAWEPNCRLLRLLLLLLLLLQRQVTWLQHVAYSKHSQPLCRQFSGQYGILRSDIIVSSNITVLRLVRLYLFLGLTHISHCLFQCRS